MNVIPKVEGKFYGGEGEDVFHMLTPYIERAGYTWTLSVDEDGSTNYTIEKI